MRSYTHILWWWILSSSICIYSLAFVVTPSRQACYSSPWTLSRRATTSNDLEHYDDDGSSSDSQPDNLFRQVFPVVSQIHGINWEGYCRYVNSDLQPQTQLKLTGGTRMDLDLVGDPPTLSDVVPSVSITITSFLVFPDGRTRQVQMKGIRKATESRPSTRLDPVGGGPIYMVLTELAPDTILLNEVEQDSGRIILTTTLSLVPDELIQSSHEIGPSATMPLEGHQLWRFKKRTFAPLLATTATATTSVGQEASMTSNQDSSNNSNNGTRNDEARRSGDRGDYRGTTGR